MPPGRPPTIDNLHIIEAVLMHKDEIIADEKIKSLVPKTHSVWSKLSEKLGDRIKPCSIYSYVVNDKFSLRTLLFNNTESSLLKNENEIVSTTNETLQSFYRNNEEDNSSESFDTYSAKRLKLNDSTTVNKASSNIDCNRFLKCCIGLVAVKGISASIFDDDEFFKTLIAPQEEKFGTNLNSDDISILLQRSSATARNVIISKLKNRIISLKLDLAIGINREVLNISVLYIDHFKICHNTLDIVPLDKKYTKIKNVVMNCLKNYELNKDQVYCYMAEVNSKVGKTEDDEENVKEHTKEKVSETGNDINNAKELLNTLTTEFHEVKNANSIIGFTVFEVLSEIESNINQHRILVKELQTIFDGLILDNATNWLSTYKMLESLLNNKIYLEEDCATQMDGLDNKMDWNFITDLITSLKPLVNLNKLFNNEQYILGDFYRDWLSCEIELEELLPTSIYAGLFVQSMQKYKQEFLRDDKFLAAIYLDPRFNFYNSVMLSEEQKRRAEAHLIEQYKVIHTTFKNRTLSLLTAVNDSENSTTIKSQDEPSTSKIAYDKLTQRIMNLSAKLNDIDEPQRNFKQKLVTLLSTKMMVPLDTNVLDYWKNTNFDADITGILEAALTVPVTQVTVGRAANALRYSVENLIDRDLLLTKFNFHELIANHVEL
ncbi:uncharacterized protein [Eurosta solidaginis]|uniref:uncharacterized protein isoform X2 n=1 Tax=Eurosta solidaginis TaxID=178769 RepID=UPI0035315FB2